MEPTKSIVSKKVFDFHRFHCINMVKGDQEILWLKKMIIKSANTVVNESDQIESEKHFILYGIRFILIFLDKC